MQKKAPYTKLLSIRCTNSSLVDGISTISPVSKLTAAVSLSALNDDLDTTKVVNNFQNPKFLEQKEQKDLVKTIKPPPVRRGGRGCNVRFMLPRYALRPPRQRIWAGRLCAPNRHLAWLWCGAEIRGLYALRLCRFLP